MSGESDPGLTAASNLLACIGMVMMTRGLHAELRALLTAFASMNSQTITDEAALAQLNATIAAQRTLLAVRGG